jgi:acetyl-CoA acetyltransferase
VNRLCGSSMDAVAVAARAIKSGEADLMIAGGVLCTMCIGVGQGIAVVLERG